VKKIYLIIAALVMLVGCATAEVVTCPGAPQNAIEHCQSISGQVTHGGGGVVYVYRGFGLSSGGGTDSRQVNQFEYMRCMKQLGYDCQVEEMVVRRSAPSQGYPAPAPSQGYSATGPSQEYPATAPVAIPPGSTAVPEGNKSLSLTEPQQVGTDRKDMPRTSESSIKKPLEYWSWGLGVAVKTDTTTTITEIEEDGPSPSKNLLQIGDEIIRIGKIDIVSTNAHKILTKKLPKEKNGFVTVVVRRDGKDIQYQIRPYHLN